MTGLIRTVRGDIEPGSLGICNAHDHLFMRSPQLPGQELDDAHAALTDLDSFAALGGGAVVQWTPWGMGQRLDQLPELSRRAGVHIVAATGLHQAKHYDATELAGVYDDLAALFVHQLTAGPVRAGLIKVAGAFHHLDEHTRHTLAAAAEAHHATGAPIGVHLEGGTAGLAVLDKLAGTHGVPPDRIILGHMHRFPDSAIHRQVAAAGAFIGFEGPSRAHHAADWRLMDIITALVDNGHSDRILLGGDTVTAPARSTGDGPGMSFLLHTLRPRIERELGSETATAIFTTNPSHAFAVEWTK
ncbi:phosphotriesterase [Nocardia sp. KC 131]|uniref:phosphotriesterase family protein n=1 Tax=Nocardia arseniciresistens TaxID=3392119 RepID=UPI00398E7CC8